MTEKPLPFAPVEKHLLASYARWAGGQAARADASTRERQHAFGLLITTSILLMPWRLEDTVVAFIRRSFDEGWQAALQGQMPPAPCGWQPRRPA